MNSHILSNIFLFLLTLVSFIYSQTPKTPSSFKKAKDIALDSVYLHLGHQKTFYCNCDFDEEKNIDAGSCGFETEKYKSRGSGVEWEHVVPASWFGKGLECYEEPDKFKQCKSSSDKVYSGRECCQKKGVNAAFLSAHNDLMNLTPAVGALNAIRSSYKFGEVEGEERNYGRCDFEYSKTTKTIEPRESVRGDIARIFLYMYYIHGVKLSDEQLQRVTRWDKDDPPSEWEKRRVARIHQLQKFDPGILDSIKKERTVKIHSVLPNPVGNDRQNETVTILNFGNYHRNMWGWILQDLSGKTWELKGTLLSGQKRTYKRRGQAMSLNNNGDTIHLKDGKGRIYSTVGYIGSKEGKYIQ